MRIPYQNKLLLTISVCTLVFIVGCVDTSVQPIPNSIDYRSQIKVVNLVQGAGTADIAFVALSSELLNSAGWTSTGWIGSNPFTHDTTGPGNVSALSNTLPAVINTYYQIVYTITGSTAGSVTITFGGQSHADITATGSFELKATTTDNFIVTPDTMIFDGKIALSVKSYTVIVQSFGSADLGSELPDSTSDFLTIPAGSKHLLASFTGTSAKYQFAAATDYKIRIFLWGTAASNELVTNYQRYIWQTPGSDNGKDLFPADTGQVAVFNGSPDAVIKSVYFSGVDTLIIVDFENTSGAIESGDGAPYVKLKSGSYSISVIYSDLLGEEGTLPAFDYTLESKGRYTVAMYDLVTAPSVLKTAVFVDD